MKDKMHVLVWTALAIASLLFGYKIFAAVCLVTGNRDILPIIPGNYLPNYVNPTYFSPSIWVSSDPDIWFDVSTYDTSAYCPDPHCIGAVYVNGNWEEVKVRYNYDDGMYISADMSLYGGNTESVLLASGTYKCTDDRLTLRVEKYSKRLPDNTDSVITFVKTRYGKGYVEPRLLCCR